VRSRRKALHWTQDDFATRCQLSGWDASRDIVAAIEGRVRRVDDFEVMVIAHVLKISIISLFPEQINWLEFKHRSLSSRKYHEQ